MAALLRAVALGGYGGDRSHGLDVVEYLLVVVAPVGQNPVGLLRSEQSDGLGTVVESGRR